MILSFRPTLRQVFGLSLLGLLLGLGLLFYLVLDRSEKIILGSSEQFRDLVSREVGQLVTTYLDEAPRAVTNFEQQIKYGLVDPKKMDSVESGLLSLLLANQNVSEATLTYATSKGFDSDGNILTDKATSGQVVVLRSTTAGEFISKRTWYDGHQFVSQSQTLRINSPARIEAPTPVAPSVDPTAHLTFQSAASSDNYDPKSDLEAIKHGRIISTDLHWSQLDEMLPIEQRRVEVSVQKAIEDSSGHFAGVLRVGLMKTEIDGAAQQHVTGPGEPDSHLIFLCDNEGRLITGFGERDRIVISHGDLRISPDEAPTPVLMALQQPVLKDIDSDNQRVDTTFRMGKETYLCTFRYLPGTQDWIVGIVVPRNFYLGPLLQIRWQVIWATFALIVVIIVAGSLIIRGVVRSHSLILSETARMKEFEFSPTHNVSYLRDVQEVLFGLEKAKTAMRAMSKYVPVNLVRQLYYKGEEPMLGGKSSEISVLFTDIKDFTKFSERMTPDMLAEVLGRYLQVMAVTIQDEKGTIDKYIGDAVMTFWNAPEPVADHEIHACRAALRCQGALQELYASTNWGDAPRFETRFGLHHCVASVGHFGAPDRFNYTAIGDGINLTSRLEELNKYYGTHIIASESIHAAAKDAFEFRLLDRVAVKGKMEGVVIYELLFERAEGKSRPQVMDAYEQAFASYQRGDFATALQLFEANGEDPPSLVMAQRCRDFQEHKPGNWSGVYVFDMK
jgi:adenylate cyclase